MEDPRGSFAALGVTSAVLVRVAGDLSAALGVEVPDDLLLGSASPAALDRHVRSRA